MEVGSGRWGVGGDICCFFFFFFFFFFVCLFVCFFLKKTSSFVIHIFLIMTFSEVLREQLHQTRLAFLPICFQKTE